jgi:hypothetical protein
MNELLDQWFKFWGREINVFGSLLLSIPYAIYAVLRWLITGKSPLPAISNLATPQAMFAGVSALLITALVAFLSSNLSLLVLTIPLLIVLTAQLALRRWVQDQRRRGTSGGAPPTP